MEIQMRLIAMESVSSACMHWQQKTVNVDSLSHMKHDFKSLSRTKVGPVRPKGLSSITRPARSLTNYYNLPLPSPSGNGCFCAGRSQSQNCATPRETDYKERLRRSRNTSEWQSNYAPTAPTARASTTSRTFQHNLHWKQIGLKPQTWQLNERRSRLEQKRKLGMMLQYCSTSQTWVQD